MLVLCAVECFVVSMLGALNVLFLSTCMCFLELQHIDRSLPTNQTEHVDNILAGNLLIWFFCYDVTCCHLKTETFLSTNNRNPGPSTLKTFL